MAANITEEDSSRYQVPPDEYNTSYSLARITPDSDQASRSHGRSAGHINKRKTC